MSDNSLFILLFWTGPIGLGFFFACLGVFIFLVSKSLPRKL
jgi:hypothetical protein